MLHFLHFRFWGFKSLRFKKKRINYTVIIIFSVIGTSLLNPTKISDSQFLRFSVSIRGAGGSRTLVQTRNTHAFYMLILLLIVELSKETDTLNSTLSPKFRYAAGASTSLSWNWWAPRSRTGIRNVHPRDVPFIHLVDELSNDLLFFDQAARA